MKKIFIFSLLISLSIFSGVSASDVSEVGTRVQKVQATTGVPSVPVGNDSKGYIGEIISKMFHATGMIKNEFITAFQSIQGSFANTLPKWDGQKFVVGTITDSGSNIGIGITNPTAKLHVNGNIQAGNKYTASYGDNTHYGYFEVKRNDGLRGAYFGYGDGDKKIQLAMDNADKFIISGGNVGIGTATPQEKLDIVGKVKADSFIGDLIGNASTATKLTNPRTINGVVFDGSENITIAGDNLGSHTATETLKMNGKNINMSGGTLNMVGGSIANLATPTAASHAATKGYVDGIAGSSEKDIKENGYYKNSDGLLMQWKTQYVASGGGWVNFPVKFDNVFSVTANRVFDNTDPSHCFAIVGKIELSRVYIDAVTRGDANCEGDINIIAVGK